MMKEINLILTLNEVNTIIDSLSKQAFIDVFKLIEKIHLQAKEQKNSEEPDNNSDA